MPRAAALLILAAIPLAAEPPPRMSLSAAQAESLGAREAGLARTAIGRRLLAETRDIPRRAAALGELVRYERVPGPQLVFDLRRIEASEPFEFELALVRELAEAAAGAPAVFRETEEIAWLCRLEFAMEKARFDGRFARRLREAVDGPAGRRGESELDLLAARLNDFSRERAAPEPSEPGLDCEVMDFGAVERLADRFGIEVLELPENLPSTVSLDGRSYPSCVIVTARSLLRAGDLIRFRESLDYFRSLAADTLKARVQEWLESR